MRFERRGQSAGAKKSNGVKRRAKSSAAITLKFMVKSDFTFGSLFTGIGGFDLGLERAEMRCAWQVENDEYAQRVLQHHWPNVERFTDVRDVGAHNLRPVDLVAGGFPCTDISISNAKGKGLDGERSGLWSQQYRIICELRPNYALIENVPNLLGKGLDRVLCDLAACGYDAEWEVISACAFGAPHTRERLFILAYPNGFGGYRRWLSIESGQDAYEWEAAKAPRYLQIQDGPRDPRRVRRSVAGLPRKLDALRGLGNAVAPPVAERIGRAILKRHREYFNAAA